MLTRLSHPRAENGPAIRARGRTAGCRGAGRAAWETGRPGAAVRYVGCLIAHLVCQSSILFPPPANGQERICTTYPRGWLGWLFTGASSVLTLWAHFSPPTEGTNGQLSNLDIVNAVSRIARKERVGTTVHHIRRGRGKFSLFSVQLRPFSTALVTKVSCRTMLLTGASRQGR